MSAHQKVTGVGNLCNLLAGKNQADEVFEDVGEAGDDGFHQGGQVICNVAHDRSFLDAYLHGWAGLAARTCRCFAIS